MRKILLLLLVILSFQAFGQTPPGYQSRLVREKVISFMVDSTLHFPRYNGVPSGVRVGGSTQSGAVAIDTLNHLFYYYSGGTWRTITGTNIYNSNGILNSDRTLTGLGNTYFLKFDSVSFFNNSYAGNSFSRISSVSAYTRIGAGNTNLNRETAITSGITNIELDPRVVGTDGYIQLHNVQYNSDANLVGLFIDTLTDNVYRKTAGGGGSGGFFNPNQTSTGNTAHDANYKSFAVTKMLSGHWKAGTGTNYMDEAYDSTYHAMVVQNGSDFYGWEANKSAGNKYMKLYARESSKDAVLTVKGDSIVLDQTDGDYRFKNLTSGSINDSIMVVGTDGKAKKRNASDFYNIANTSLTSTANHTLDFNGFTQTYTGGTEIHDSLTFTNTIIYPTNATSLVAYGNSITAGQNASPGNEYITLYGAALGLTVTNHAVGGRGSWRAVSEANAEENPGDTKVATVMAGFNDVRRTDTTTALTYRKTLNKIINAHKVIFINHFLKSYEDGGNGADVTRYGSWSTNYPSNTIGGKSNAHGAYSLTLNDSIVYSFTDNNVVFSMIGGDGTTEVYSNSFEIYLDGVLQSTETARYTTDAISDGADGNTRQPIGFIYTGLTYGAHKVKIVNKNGGGTNYIIIDYFGHLVDPNNAYPLIIFHAPKMDATGYASVPAGASDHVIDVMNSKLDSLIATFPSVYPVFTAHTNTYYTNTTASGDLDAADHIHPTTQGHLHIYDAAIAAYSSTAPTTGLARRLFWSNDRPYVFDNTNTLHALVYQGEAATVAGSNKQVQYNNGGVFGGAAGLEVGNTNIRLRSEAQATTEIPFVTKGFAGQTAAHYQAQSSTGSPLFSVDASGGIQVLGTFVSAPIGSGSLEMEYTGGAGYISSYNRNAGTWQDLNLRGANLNFKTNNVTRLGIADATTTISNRLLKTQGADVGSVSGAIALGTDGNTFEITGTNAITLISNLNWQNGSEIVLIFTSTATLTDGTANSGTDIGMELAGNINFSASADDVVTLVLCEIGGVQRWREKSRSVN